MIMTLIDALNQLAKYNKGVEILVKTNSSEPMTIEGAIDDILQSSDGTEECDLYADGYMVRELDESGYIKSGDAIYMVCE